MAVTPSPFGPKPQFVDSAGNPDISYKVFFYVAGSNTKQDTYTSSTGVTANANPVILNSLGQPTNEIWFTVGQFYKVVLAPSTDTDPPTSPIWTIDNLQGMGTVTTTTTQDEWVLFAGAPTFISTTSFSVAGNQTATFQAGRRVKTTNTAGTIYSTISASVFGAVTTVTVVNDSGVLDAGLSAVSYGLLSVTNPSIPETTIGKTVRTAATAATAYAAIIFAPSMVRLSLVNGYGSTNTVIRRWATTVTNIGTDITYADSATLGGTFTINTAGVYAVSYVDDFSALAVLGLSLNSTQLTTAFTSIATADKLASTVTVGANSEACASWTGYVTAGSVIRAHTDATTTGTAARTYFTITRVA